MNSLDRKLVRDLWHTRGQVIAILDYGTKEKLVMNHKTLIQK